MVTQLYSSETVYPESDGKPMADNTQQYLWIVLIKEGLELLFQTNASVFIAADLLWYPVEGNNRIVTAPDVMVVWGRPKGHRGSYQQWKEANIPPQVVFEIRSPSNRQTEMDEKLVFYDRHGVEEYYLYNPDNNDLSGWLRTEGRLEVINPIDGWTSPRLGIQFVLSGKPLQLLRPDGESFINYVEMAYQREQERQRAEQERQRAEQERQRAEQERQRAEQAEARAARLSEYLRSQGIDPDAL